MIPSPMGLLLTVLTLSGGLRGDVEFLDEVMMD